jgi:hypothetical protein
MLKPDTHAAVPSNVVNPDSMAEETLTSPAPSPRKSTWAAWKSSMPGLSLSRFQAIVGTLAGIASLIGAAFSLVQFARPASTGNLVTIVQAAGSRSVADATIEVLTTQDAIVATLTPDATGRVAQQLPEGVYVVRVSHPGYAADVRRIHVLPRQTVEIRATLRTESPSSIERAANSGLNAVRKALRF